MYNSRAIALETSLSALPQNFLSSPKIDNYIKTGYLRMAEQFLPFVKMEYGELREIRSVLLCFQD
jgi:hypothetical protein